MEVLRWLLIAATLVLGFIGATARVTGNVGLLVVGSFAALNLIYLLTVTPRPRQPGTGRLSRMFGLWLNAKEADLQSRAQRLR